MEMRRYVKHSAAWWVVTIILLAVTVGCVVMGILLQKSRKAIEATPLAVDDVYLDDYNYIDVQYMTEWVYKVTLGTGEQEVFYIAWDAEDYGYLVRLEDAQYAQFADIVAYTYSGEPDVPSGAGQAQGLSPLSADIPADDLPDSSDDPGDTPQAVKPAPVRLSGVIRTIPEDYLADLASHEELTNEAFLQYYGDYYIDGTMTPSDLDNDCFFAALLVFCFASVFLISAIAYSSQLSRELKRLRKAGLLDRAESEFHYLKGDPRSDALLSTAFIYGRHQNIVLPLSDVLWVYRHDIKLLFAKSVVVQLMTYDGRAYALRMSRGASRRTADAIVQAVAARNPEVLVGLTRENHRLYDRQVPRTKQQYVRVGLIWAVWIAASIIMNVVLRIIWS